MKRPPGYVSGLLGLALIGASGCYPARTPPERLEESVWLDGEKIYVGPGEERPTLCNGKEPDPEEICGMHSDMMSSIAPDLSPEIKRYVGSSDLKWCFLEKAGTDDERSWYIRITTPEGEAEIDVWNKRLGKPVDHLLLVGEHGDVSIPVSGILCYTEFFNEDPFLAPLLKR